jgi:uracil-DNA glycosylase family 4
MHPRTLARQFAATLAELRETWDVEYWPAGKLPIAERSTAPAEAQTQAPAARLPIADDVREKAKAWTPAQKLEYLRERNVGDCQRCGLARTRSKIVFGVGNPEAKLVFVGEAPGADEDRQGEPFVGRAGAKLTAWIGELGLTRDDVYIANVLKCRPPGNRDPKPEEVDKCSPFLRAQIRAISPRVIVALGKHAGMLLTGREEMTLKAMRTAKLTYDVDDGAGGTRRIPIVVTYHPAYVLRQEGSERGVESTANSTVDSTERMVMQDLRRALDLTNA